MTRGEGGSERGVRGRLGMSDAHAERLGCELQSYFIYARIDTLFDVVSEFSIYCRNSTVSVVLGLTSALVKNLESMR